MRAAELNCSARWVVAWQHKSESLRPTCVEGHHSWIVGLKRRDVSAEQDRSRPSNLRRARKH
jgi:hypothetical protein